MFRPGRGFMTAVSRSNNAVTAPLDSMYRRLDAEALGRREGSLLRVRAALRGATLATINVDQSAAVPRGQPDVRPTSKGHQFHGGMENAAQ